MATTLATVEAREVLRCEHCTLVQFRTGNSRCRRCHKPLEVEEPEQLLPHLVTDAGQSVEQDRGLQISRAVRDLRRQRSLSQRQLAGRMQVPRTYISKIENGKAMPTLSSLERLATALEIDICHLLRDARSQRQEQIAAVMSDPFVCELVPQLARLDGYHRSLLLNQVRDMASGRRRAMA
ncbi:helix-turn-helix domain-containing protein [Acidipila rosea]|uniref:helix-turn-helix domain-containing protein n=1 Tax=Acidipila rosea TaxID=768535 RepID=UPI00104E4F5D|nr:helix-turn-helix transcriptional regulator [Acidipila rosea]MBW4043744.1 helix-turn-helix transcriptional regulator [Acidobacteriota bacterium]